MTLGDDTRGVSITVTYTLTVAIASLLVFGLVASSGGLLGSNQERAVRAQLQDAGGQVTDELIRVDRLVNGSLNASNVSVDVGLPSVVAGTSYDIHLVDDGSEATVYLNASGVDVSYPIGVDTETDVCESRVDSGRVKVVYDRTQQCLTLEEP